MALKNLLVVVLILILNIAQVSIIVAAPSGFQAENNNLQAEKSLKNSKDFVHYKFRYIAPKSGFVYLIWKTENFANEEAIYWNDSTKLSNGLLYTPMSFMEDTFRLDLRLEKGAVLQYYFWITKNKQGHYQDFWDLHSSGRMTTNDNGQIVKNANYTKVEKRKTTDIVDKAWILLILFIILYFSLFWIQKKWFSTRAKVSIVAKIIFVGISLMLFHAMARAEIIHVGLRSIFQNLWSLPQIIRGSISDILFVSVLTLIFIVSGLIIKNTFGKKVLYGFFIFLAIISTLIAFVNIKVVVYLGKPFNYQWLYYSDFLGSEDAMSVFKENLSLVSSFNLIAMCISMLLVTRILDIFYSIIKSQKKLLVSFYTLIGFGLIVSGGLAYKAKSNWTKGQSENAISTMLMSIYSANSSSSFLSNKFSNEMPPFQLSQNISSENYNISSDENGVKNLLFIILESAGAVYFDAYGGTFNLSPNLNRYSSQALIIDQMYAHAPATNRSLVSILGSLYPYLSYKSLTQEAPDVELPTISSVLKKNGYRTSFFSSADLSFQNCRQFLTHRSFDVVEDYTSINCDKEFFLDTDYKEGNGKDDMCLADRLNAWLDEDPKTNFFSMIWTVQGHYPYFFAQKEEDFGVSNLSFNRYLNCLKHNDELLGRVMQSLEEKGLSESTLVVVVGDHGEAFGQHKQYGHGTAIYEENMKVPLYLINPVLFNGKRKNDIAGMKDLAPTALSILNIEIPEIWQGRNILTTSSDEAFYFAPWSDYLFGYRKGSMKYIFNETRNTVEIYDLSTDPAEKSNLYHQMGNEHLNDIRLRVAEWVQYQDKFVKKLLSKSGK
jgi:phosphoglycerol transferase MdoB-like AlkP superfamily enzyme